MADTGFKFPGTMVGNRGAGSTVWANPDNAKANDAVYASVLLFSVNSKHLAASNFDFSVIPAGSTIDGIEVEVQGYDHSVGTSVWNALRLILADDSDGSENKQAELSQLTTSLQTDVAGGASDLWSETIIRADVQDIDFGFQVSINATDVGNQRIDSLRMKVFYTEGGASGTVASIIDVSSEVLQEKGGQGAPMSLINMLVASAGKHAGSGLIENVIDLLATIDGSAGIAKSGIIELLIDASVSVDETPGRQAVAKAIINILADALESTNRQAVAEAIVDQLAAIDGKKTASNVASAIINLLAKTDGSQAEAHSGVAQLLIDAATMTDGTPARSSTAQSVIDLMASVAETTNRSAVAEVIIDQLATVASSADRQAVASAVIDVLVSMIGGQAEAHSGVAKALLDTMAFGLGRKTAVMTSSQVIDVTVDLSGLANKQQVAQSIIDALAVTAGLRMRSGVVQLLLDLPVDLLAQKGAQAISRSIADLATQAQGQGARSGAAQALIDLLGLVDGLPQRSGLVDERIGVAASIKAIAGTPAVVIRTISLTGVFHVDHPIAGVFAPDRALDGKIIG